MRLEEGLIGVLERVHANRFDEAKTLARVITAILYLSITASAYLKLSDQAVLAEIHDQIKATLAPERGVA